MKPWLLVIAIQSGFLLIAAACPPLGIALTVVLVGILLFGNIVDAFGWWPK